MNIYAKAKKIHIFKDPYILASTLQTSFAWLQNNCFVSDYLQVEYFSLRSGVYL